MLFSQTYKSNNSALSKPTCIITLCSKIKIIRKYVNWKQVKSFVVVIVQLLSHIWLFLTLWIAAHQAWPTFTISLSVFELMSIESMMPSNHLILCNPLLLLPPQSFPVLGSFPKSRLFASHSQNTGDSASESVLLMNI